MQTKAKRKSNRISKRIKWVPTIHQYALLLILFCLRALFDLIIKANGRRRCITSNALQLNRLYKYFVFIVVFLFITSTFFFPFLFHSLPFSLSSIIYLFCVNIISLCNLFLFFFSYCFIFHFRNVLILCWCVTIVNWNMFVGKHSFSLKSLVGQ